jgi:transcriptional regulator with XRE-family HTH domain
MAISERIKKLCDIEGSQANFIRKTGINRGTVNQIINQNGGMTNSSLELVLKAYPNLNARWLITGEGETWEAEEDVQLKKELEETKRELAEVKEKLESKERVIGSLSKLSDILQKDNDRLLKKLGLD